MVEGRNLEGREKETSAHLHGPSLFPILNRPDTGCEGVFLQGDRPEVKAKVNVN
jgi:hypothetical protein